MPQREKESKGMNGQDLVEGSVPEQKGVSVPMEEPPNPGDPVWQVRAEPVSTPQTTWSREAILQGSPALGWGGREQMQAP